MNMRKIYWHSLLWALLLILPGDATEAKKKKQVMHIRGGVIDEIDLRVEVIEGSIPVMIRPFTTENVNLGTGKKGGKEKRVRAAETMVKIAPDLLQKIMKTELEASGIFGKIFTGENLELPEESIIIEGDFVLINPGSRAKRYWAGFGAGKSGVGVEGRVINKTGMVLAEFKHRKHSGIGIAAGNYVKFMSDDTEDVGKDIVKFLVSWATRKDLRED